MLTESSELSNKHFKAFKQAFALRLANEDDIDVEDVLKLVTPLALENIEGEEMWSHLADIVISNEHRIKNEDFLTNCTKLAWAFTKANFKDNNFWKFIDRCVSEELARLREDNFPAREAGSKLANICLTLQDNHGEDLAEQFWTQLSSSIKDFLYERERTGVDFDDSEYLQIIRECVDKNPHLDKSLL